MEPFYRRPITFKTLLMGFAFLCAPGVLWLLWNIRPLNIASEFGINTPATPSPNAHDLYRLAYNEIEAASKGQPAPSVLLDTTVTGDDKYGDEDTQQYPWARKVAWVNLNRKGLATFSSALRVPHLYSPIRDEQPEGEIPVPGYLRELAKFVTVESQMLAAQGQSEQAVDRALDIWQMGLDAGRGAPLTVALNAIAVEIYARRALDGEIAPLNGIQARKLAQRMEKLVAVRVTYRQILEEERATSLFQVRPALEDAVRDEREKKEFKAALEREDYNYSFSSGPAPRLHGPLVTWIVRRLAHEQDRAYKTLLSNADAPWSQRQVTAPPDVGEKTAALINVLQKSKFMYCRAEVFAQMTLTRLALHAYRKERGTYPPSLQSLVPTYLSKVPSDPFSDGQPLRYQVEGKRYKLWSAGPDARDDSARPIEDLAARTPATRHTVKVESFGDIVANVNR